MKVRSSKFSRILIVFSVLLLAFICLFTIVVTIPGERLLRNQMEIRLSRVLGAEVRLGRLETNLVTRVQLWDADIRSHDGARRLCLEYGRVNYRIWELLRRDGAIRGIQMDSLTIDVKRDSAGRLAFAFELNQEKTDKAARAPKKIRLQDLDIKHAVIFFDDRQIPLQGRIFDLDVKWDQELNERYRWSVTADSARLMLEEKHVDLIEWDASGFFGQGEWEIRNLHVKTHDMAMSGQASGERAADSSTLRGSFHIGGRIEGIADLLNDALPRSLSPVYGDLDVDLHLDGTLRDPRCVAQGRIRNTRLGEVVISDGQLHASYRDSTVELKNLSLNIIGGRLFGNGYLTLDRLLDHRLSLDVQEVKFRDLWKIIYRDSVTDGGVISGRWISAGPLYSPEDLYIESEFNLKKARYRKKTLPEFNINLSARPGKIDVLIAQEENRVEGNLKISARSTEGDFTFNIHRIGPLAELLHIEDLSGSLEGGCYITGDMNYPDIDLEIRGQALRYQNFPMDSLEIHAAYTNKKLFIQDGRFSGQYASDDASRPLLGFRQFSGNFSYRGVFSGPIIEPEGEIRAEMFKPEFDDVRFDDGTMRVVVKQGRIYLDALTLRKDSLRIQAKGLYRTAQAGGRLEVSFYDVTKDTHISTIEQKANSKSFQDALRFGSITADFDRRFKREWLLEARGSGIHLDKISAIYREVTGLRGVLGFDLALSGMTHEPQGLLHIRGDSVGLGRAFMDSVRCTLQIKDSHLTAAPVEMYFGERRSWAEADFKLMSTATSGYALTGESEIQGRAEGSGIDLGFFSPIIGPVAHCQGIGDYELVWTGRLGRPRIRGLLQLKNGEILFRPGTDPIRSIEARFSLADSVLQIGPITGKIRQIPFRTAAHVTIQDRQSFRFDAHLAVSGAEAMAVKGFKTADSLKFRVGFQDLNLSLFRDFISELRGLDGRLDCNINIAGPVKLPRFAGFLELKNMVLQPTILDQPLSEGIVKATFENEKINLDSLFFRMNEGTVSAGGNLILSGREIKNLNSWVTIDRLRFDRPKAFTLNIQSVKANMRKEQGEVTIEGDIILGETRFIRDVQPAALSPFLQKVERPMASPPEFLGKIRIDLRVRDSQRLWIDNNIARLRLRSELGFIGSLARPNLSGRLSVEEGYVLYLDRKFRVQHCILDFADPHRINPLVDFNARADIKGYQTWSRQPYTVMLGIRGPLDNAVIDLTSNPPLERSDIITLLTVGATREQLVSRDEGGKSSFTNILEDRVGYLSSRRISGFASRRIGNLLGLQDMTIDGNLFRFGDSWGPQLLASKKITDRMEISYTTRVGHANEQSIRLDYRLSKNLSIEGQTDQQGRSGIDFKFRWKFK